MITLPYTYETPYNSKNMIFRFIKRPKTGVLFAQNRFMRRFFNPLSFIHYNIIFMYLQKNEPSPV